MKTCSKCGSHGPFHKGQYRCTKCREEYRLYKFQQDPVSARAKRAKQDRVRNLRLSYNLTVELWDALLESQGRQCKVCKTFDPGPKGWHTDHDHVTGKVRGILCSSCNVGLGCFHDSVDRLQRAIEYLRSN